jgi:hypothetical protein
VVSSSAKFGNEINVISAHIINFLFMISPRIHSWIAQQTVYHQGLQLRLYLHSPP